MDKIKLMPFVEWFMVDDYGNGGVSVVEEETAPEPTYNQVQYVQPAVIQMKPCEFVEKRKEFTGESLAVDKNDNVMIAISSKTTWAGYWHSNKKITSKDFRVVSEGYVDSCKKYNYICEDGVRFYYKIATNL